ncbi:class I SAM-dependent methyltransferase [Brevibacillus sp. NPDC058079]|uniref:class I SAM-dependent methyltransferase n=1 Tax=Brevibacillus sp. NPDC058079 TaxID=3346330 RepID=UPI0036EB1726
MSTFQNGSSSHRNYQKIKQYEIEQEYWNRLYHASQSKSEIAWFNPYLDLLPKRSQVFEIGCGTGDLGQFLIDNNHEVTGIDLSDEAILRAKEAVPKGKWFSHDIRNPLPLEDHSFDVIIASLSLHYFEDSQLTIITNELERVIKKDGVFVFRINSTNDQEANNMNNSINRRYFSKEEMDQWLSNWKVLEVGEKKLTYYGKMKCLWEGIAICK